MSALGFTSFSLKRAEFRAVVHEEQRLAELIISELQEQWWVHENMSIFLNAAEGKHGLLIYADFQPAGPPTSEVLRQGTLYDRMNTEIHKLEERYF